MKLKIGDSAEAFDVSDIHGKNINLDEYRGKKLMLSFYRYASCPLCNLRVQKLIQNYESLDGKGLHLLAFFESPEESIIRYVGKQKPPFSIIADPERIIYKKYGVESSWIAFLLSAFTRSYDGINAFFKGFLPGKLEGEIALLPADFLIDENHKISIAYYGKDIGDHLPLDEIESWLLK